MFLTSTEARRPIRDGDKGGRGKSEDSRQAPTRKTRDAVDRRQNNRMLRQCPLAIAQQLMSRIVHIGPWLVNYTELRSCVKVEVAVLGSYP